ncbi:hypothetical protein [Micromonospora sp. NPDC049891]|uniref:hypothetical protein n=1 Tax=Micromonospora sp. NPDC049891 TaxID=3155655 RepID=UPI0033D9ECA4
MHDAAISVPVTRLYGRYEITAQTTVDGGYNITTMTATGGHPEDLLCFTVADRDVYRTIYAVIREGGLNHVDPAGVRDAIRDALGRDLRAMQRRHDTASKARADYLNDLLDGFESPAETAEVDALIAFAAKVGDAVAAGVADVDRPRTFAELRDSFQAAAAADRAARKAVK